MCTAISMKTHDCYFGRNLDYEHTFGEGIVITPKNYSFRFTNGKTVKQHSAIFGTALISQKYPLYFDAANENGLGMAGLNFPHYACYKKACADKENVASFELIPYVLSGCSSLPEAKKLLSGINITDTRFSPDMSPTPLHWFVTDGENSITAEQTENGMKIYENPVGVLTNSPEFDMHMENLTKYMNLTPHEPQNNFSDKVPLNPSSRGLGAFGIPGDLSSMSRFVRASFTKLNLICDENEHSSVTGFFHALYSVYQQKGCVRLETGLEKTNYSCCYNLQKGIYYFTTYENPAVAAVDMHRENLDGNKLVQYRKISGEVFKFIN